MSKEKECKCCKEESDFLDIVTGLCPNCYDYFKQLKQQVEEKDKEIANLKNFISCKGCVDVIKKSNENQTQLAIQELEKVKDYICDCTYIKEPDYTNVRRKIDNQIKELKEGK